MEKRRIYILGALAIAACIGAVFLSRAQGQPGPASAASAWQTVDSNSTGQGAVATREALMKLAWSIVIVAVLGGFAIWASRKWLPKVTAPKGKKIQVIETVQLGHQRSLHIINVGTQKFLISSAPESVRMLADVTLAMEEERR